MQEADADDALTGADILARTGTGLGINLYILVKVREVFDAFVVALQLDHEVGNQFRGAGGVVVGQPDKALVLGLQQIIPGLRSFQAQTGQFIGVDHKAEDTGVDAVPVAVRILVDVLGQVRGVFGNIAVVEQAFGRGGVIGVVGAAEPDVGRGFAVLFFDLGRHFAG